MRGTDAQVRHPAGPVGLVGSLGHHHLRRTGPRGGGGGARAPVVDDGRDVGEEHMVGSSPTARQSSRSSIGVRPDQPR